MNKCFAKWMPCVCVCVGLCATIHTRKRALSLSHVGKLVFLRSPPQCCRWRNCGEARKGTKWAKRIRLLLGAERGRECGRERRRRRRSAIFLHLKMVNFRSQFTFGREFSHSRRADTRLTVMKNSAFLRSERGERMRRTDPRDALALSPSPALSIFINGTKWMSHCRFGSV